LIPDLCILICIVSQPGPRYADAYRMLNISHIYITYIRDPFIFSLDKMQSNTIS